MTKEENMKKIVLYTRVSTKLESQENSINTQREVYTEYCQRNGFELVEVYADKGTGTNVRKRPDFIRMLSDAGLDYERNENNGYDNFSESKRKPKFSYILVKDVSRFSRNQHLGLLIAEYLRNKGVYIIFENANLNTNVDDWHMRLSLLFTFAQEESRSMSRRIKFSKQHNISKNIFAPSRLPYGFIRNEKKEIVIHPEQSLVVKLIYDLYEEKGSYQIAKILNEKGYTSQNNLPFSEDKVLRIIRNKLFCGIGVVGKSTKIEVTDTHRKQINKEDWVEIPNVVEPIVSIKQWEEANKKREGRINKNTKRGVKPATHDDFYGKIYCECGSRFVRHSGRNNAKSKVKLIYMCQARRKRGDCDARGLSFNILDEMFNEVDIRFLSNEMGNQSYYKTLLESIESESRNISKRIDEFTVEIEKLQSENNMTLQSIKNELTGGSQVVIKMLSDDIDSNQKKIDELIEARNKINIDTIHYMTQKVEMKKQLIEGIKNGQSISREERLKLLKTIIVNDYEVKIEFHLPSFEEEVAEFNETFKSASINLNMGFQPFNSTFKRDHKEAREYWNQVDESSNETEY